MAGRATFDQQIAAGKAKLKGKREVYDQLKSTLVQFELGFEMMPGTKAPAKGKVAKKKKGPFEQDLARIIHGHRPI